MLAHLKTRHFLFSSVPKKVIEIGICNFQCALCTNLRKSKVEAEEQLSTHASANQTIISLIQRNHEQERLFQRTASEYKKEVAELKQRVQVLETSQIQAPREPCLSPTCANKTGPVTLAPHPNKQKPQKMGKSFQPALRPIFRTIFHAVVFFWFF